MSIIDTARRIIKLLRFKKRLNERDDFVSNKLEDVVDDGIEAAIKEAFGSLTGDSGDDSESTDWEWGSDN